jgi:hypothetical protein
MTPQALTHSLFNLTHALALKQHDDRTTPIHKNYEATNSDEKFAQLAKPRTPFTHTVVVVHK